MNRATEEAREELVDLGAASVLTRGGHGPALDGEGNIVDTGLSDD